jgi:hypothetical protein
MIAMRRRPTGPLIRPTVALWTLFCFYCELVWIRYRLRLRILPWLYWLRFRIFVRTWFWTLVGRGPRRRR